MSQFTTVRGNVGTSPQTPTGESKFSSFRIAATHRRFNKASDTWEDENTTWYTVKCWRRLAENVFSSIEKGDPVVVIGRPQLAQWEKEDGTTGSDLEIYAEVVAHDLNRGTTAFTKAGAQPARTTEPTNPNPATENSEPRDPWAPPTSESATSELGTSDQGTSQSTEPTTEDSPRQPAHAAAPGTANQNPPF